MPYDRRLAAGFACVVILLQGCGSSHTTAPAPEPIGIEGDFYRLRGDAYGEDALLTAVGGSPDSRIFTMEANGKPIGGAFLRAPSGYVNAGTIRIWEFPRTLATADTLALYSVPVRSVPWFLYSSWSPAPEAPALTFDGHTWHRFSVAGSTEFPAFEDSVLSVSTPVVPWPAEGDTIMPDSDLVVPTAGTTPDATVHAWGYVSSRVTSSFAPGTSGVHGNEVAFVDHRFLSQLPPGAALLNVVRERYHTTMVGTTPVLVKCSSVLRRPIVIRQTASNAALARRGATSTGLLPPFTPVLVSAAR